MTNLTQIRKATATNFYIRNINGSLSELVNARNEISCGRLTHFQEVNEKEFLLTVAADDRVTVIRTKSNKLIEVTKKDFEK